MLELMSELVLLQTNWLDFFEYTHTLYTSGKRYQASLCQTFPLIIHHFSKNNKFSGKQNSSNFACHSLVVMSLAKVRASAWLFENLLYGSSFSCPTSPSFWHFGHFITDSLRTSEMSLLYDVIHQTHSSYKKDNPCRDGTSGMDARWGFTTCNLVGKLGGQVKKKLSIFLRFFIRSSYLQTKRLSLKTVFWNV